MPVLRPARALVLGPALAALACAALVALAAAPARAAGKIAVQLLEVLGTDPGPGPKTFDPGLEEIQDQLKVYRYQKFKNRGKDRKDLADGAEATFPLSAEPGFKAEVTAASSGAGVTLELRVLDAKGKEVLKKTTLKIKDGGTSIIMKELEDRTGHLFLVFTVKRS